MKKMGHIQAVKRCFRAAVEVIKREEHRIYKFRKRKRLRNKNFTIISSNCNGSIMYHDMGLRYLTPTVNLAIGMDDFVRMAGDLRQYMGCDISETESDAGFPVGCLGTGGTGIRINFMHYDSFADGVAKWDERKRRINWENIFIVGVEKDGCSYETLKRFDALPWDNKVVFTKAAYPEFPSAYHIKGFEDKDEIGVLTEYKNSFWRRRYLDDFDYVGFLNRPLDRRYGGSRRV